MKNKRIEDHVQKIKDVLVEATKQGILLTLEEVNERLGHESEKVHNTVRRQLSQDMLGNRVDFTLV